MANKRSIDRLAGLSGVCHLAACKAEAFREYSALSRKVRAERANVVGFIEQFEAKGHLHTLGLGPLSATAVVAHLDGSEPLVGLSSVTDLPKEWLKLAQLGYWELLFQRLNEIAVINRAFIDQGLKPVAVYGRPGLDQLELFSPPDDAA